MNTRFLQFIILAAGVLCGLSACNSDSDNYTQESVSQAGSSTLVSSFSLKPNAKILSRLDSVYFSIDQVKGEIFNADSLPWGTDVRKLTLNVQVASASNVEIIMPKLTDGTDTVINYMQNPTDSINFTNGQVWLRVGSSDGEFERIYSVKVNVHKCNADSLQWNMSPTPLPGNPASPRAQRAAELNGKYYSLCRTASALTLATADNPAGDWHTEVVRSLPADVDVSSFTATADALYVRSSSGDLYTCADGLSWHKISEGWSYVYGAYADQLVGLKEGKWLTWPGGLSGALPEGMPVSGTSQMWTFTDEWALAPQAIFVGGKKADGTLSTDSWGFDGTSWAQLSGVSGSRALPAAQGWQLLPYFTFRINKNNFRATRQSAWIAFGGTLANGTAQKQTYISLDNGLNWRLAADNLQLPAAMAPRYGASIILCEKQFTASSRAVKPVTEWDAPYIYLFGGYKPDDGTLLNQSWVGVINRLTFKPLQ